MNSEELEISLRSEFETYLKTARAELRREAAEFQDRIESEFERQKAQFDEAFLAFSSRFDSEPDFDEGFRGSVAEHLRLARDEGARIAATATDEAVRMAQEDAPPPKYDAIRDAIKDISTKDSQSAILKTLVTHAETFAPRGAFFIIKSEHFVGWKVFGSASEAAESKIREVHFETSADSVLAAAASSMETTEASARQGDSAFLEPLQFGEPERMYAIPLVARHRTVAVLYADHGDERAEVNREALETLVSVAGLTVELLASMQTAKAENRSVTADFEDTHHEADEHRQIAAEPAAKAPQQSFDEADVDTDPSFHETIRDPSFTFTPPVPETKAPDFSFNESVSYEGGFPAALVPPAGFEMPPAAAEPYEPSTPQNFADEEAASETIEYNQPYVPQAENAEFESAKTDPDMFSPPVTTEGALTFDSGGSIESAAFESSPFEARADSYEPVAAPSVGGFNPVVEPVAAAAPAPTRLSDRHVDLPIEVPEEERRIHNDARRFARLLVSEIKLYNEKKVMEGREANDLYERLREAIDRSREMYDKRVQPPVAAKFDYFHYEVVNSLAEGDAARLGASYPGSAV